jgi:hypothetical protein
MLEDDKQIVIVIMVIDIFYLKYLTPYGGNCVPIIELKNCSNIMIT